MADLHHAMNKLQDAKQEGGVSGYEKQYKVSHMCTIVLGVWEVM